VTKVGDGSGELRLALGMRGGVSLAVWIGGACAEVDRLRRCAEEPGSFWSEVLAGSPYERVVVDVIAGASAGGLNGVLYAASQRYGFSLSEVRQLWLELGDLRSLLRPLPDKRRDADVGRRALSLLDGDEGFRKRLDDTLVELIRAHAGKAETPSPSTIDLRLSATLVAPIVRRVPGPVDEALEERRFATQFHFRHRAGRPWAPSDLPDLDGPDDPALEAVAFRLAMAARASSSYPVAFEPAVVPATRRQTFRAMAGTETTVTDDLSAVFSDCRSPAPADPSGRADFTVMDGGVLDNIPLGKALRAVAAVPASRRTDRYLVYVQPGSVTPGEQDHRASDRADVSRSVMGVAVGAIGALLTAENIADDVAELEAHNDAVERAVTMRLGTLAQVGPEPGAGLLEAARAAWAHYEPHRAHFDARLLRALLDDPLGFLGHDPFPRTIGGRSIPDEAWRSPIAHWPGTEREHLVAVLTGRFGRRLDGRGEGGFMAESVTRAGVRPLLRVVTLLLEWARHLQTLDVEAATEAKPILYRTLAFVEDVVEHPRRLGWVAWAAAAGPEGAGGARDWVKTAGTALNRLLLVSPATAEALVDDLRQGGAETVSAYRADVLDRLDHVLDPAPPEDGDATVDLRDRLFGLAADVADGLRRAADARGPALVAGPDDDPDPGGLLDRALRAQEITPSVLAALEVVCFPEFVAGLPGQRRIELVRLSAGNRTPLAPWFEELRRAADEQEIRWVPPPGTEDRAPAPDGIPAALKLAGNELKNFAAFLKDEWRANDWMWGRLDAVPTLVDLLVTPKALQDHLGSASPAAEERVRELVVGAADPEWRRWLEDHVWPVYREQVMRELGGLDVEGARVDAIRDALVARRQWEILAEELAMPNRARRGNGGERSGSRPLTPIEPLPPKKVVSQVEGYDVGAETITRPKHRQHARLAADLSHLVAAVIEDNVAAATGGAHSTSGRPWRLLAAGSARMVSTAGPLAARVVLAPGTGRVLALARRLPAVTTGAGLGLAAYELGRRTAPPAPERSRLSRALGTVGVLHGVRRALTRR
jgi:predicted acylesterase/phospholipase RssA